MNKLIMKYGGMLAALADNKVFKPVKNMDYSGSGELEGFCDGFFGSRYLQHQ